jgi:hypothetical protein
MDTTRWKVATSTDDSPDVCTPSGEKKINPELLFYLDTGKKRSKKYFDAFSMTGDVTKPERSEKESEGGVSLALIEGDMSKVASNAEDALARWVSLDQVFLEKRGVWTTVEVTKELKSLNTQLGPGNAVRPAVNANGNSTKPFKISAIIKARSKLIAQDPDWARSRHASILAESGSINHLQLVGLVISIVVFQRSANILH